MVIVTANQVEIVQNPRSSKTKQSLFLSVQGSRIISEVDTIVDTCAYPLLNFSNAVFDKMTGI